MSKTKHAKPGATTPQASQLAAVRRLADAGKLLEARQRHAALRQAYPGFKPLLGLAWEIEWLAGDPIIAAARAWGWQLASPNSRQALEALAESAREAGLAALAARAGQRLRGLESGRTEDAPMQTFDAPLGPLTFEQAQAIDLSRMHLADGQPGAAAAVLQGVDHPSARNNLALALFDSGDLRQALAVADEAWQANADNLFALDHALRWRCWFGGMERCAGYRELLRAAVPRRAEDATARIAALRFLGDLEGARRAWDDVEDKDYWEHAAEEQLDLFEALGDALGDGDADEDADADEAGFRVDAIEVGAQAGRDRVIDRDLAADADIDASDDDTDDTDADFDDDFDDDIDDDIDALTQSSPWFTPAWTQTLHRVALDSKATSDAEVQTLWAAHLDACDAHADYLKRACEIGGAMVRVLALAVLKRRAKQGDAAALSALTGLLVSMGGTDATRLALLNWLNDEGLRDPAAPATMLSAGKVREMRSIAMNISAEPRPSPYSPEGTLLSVQMHEAIGQRDFDAALELALRLREMHPEQPSALTNVASIEQALGTAPVELISMYREALALAPDHLFARCGLARLLAPRGKLDEARALLEGLLERKDWHYSEYRSYMLAQRAMALAQGEHQALLAMDETLLDIERRFGG